MSSVEKYKRLLDLLWQRTLERALDWRWDPPAKTLTCWVGARPLTVKQTNNEEHEPLYVFTIFNDRSEPVERFNDEFLEGKPAHGDFKNYFDLCDTLFETGQRQATGADIALDDILTRLEKNDIGDVPF